MVDASYNPAAGTSLRSGNNLMVRLANPVTGTLSVSAQQTRQLTLNEVMGMPVTAVDPVTGVVTAYPGGPLEILVDNTKWFGTRSCYREHTVRLQALDCERRRHLLL